MFIINYVNSFSRANSNKTNRPSALIVSYSILSLLYINLSQIEGPRSARITTERCFATLFVMVCNVPSAIGAQAPMAELLLAVKSLGWREALFVHKPKRKRCEGWDDGKRKPRTKGRGECPNGTQVQRNHAPIQRTTPTYLRIVPATDKFLK